MILEEKPVLCCQFSWNAEYGYSACDNCMRPLETAEENVRRLTGNSSIVLPHMEHCETKKELITECPACGVKYCSSECQDEAFQKYHRTLCLQSRKPEEVHPLVQLNEKWKQMNYPPETATIMLLARMVAFVNQSTDKAAAIATFSQFCQRTVNDTQEIAHNLLDEKYVGDIDILRVMIQNAINTEFVPQWFTPEGFRGLLALVGTNGQGIGTSSFSRWVKNIWGLSLPEEEMIHCDKLIDKLYDEMDEVVGDFLSNEGSGLYLTQSTANHSCSPNATVEFPYCNSTLILRAIRDIQPGEEICISYLSECELEKSRYARQKSLKSYYLFVCRCEKCQMQANDPDETSEDDDEEEKNDANMSD